MRSHSKPGHCCRAVGVLALVAVVGLMGCTTTTRLGPAADPYTARAIEDLATQSNAQARVTPSAAPLRPVTVADAPYPVVGHAPGSLTISEPAGPVEVPLIQVQSVSTYGHARGALEGGAAAGAVGLALGFGAGYLFPRGCPADAPCGPSPMVRGLEVGAVVGLVTAALGATVGAVIGHENRSEIAAP